MDIEQISEEIVSEIESHIADSLNKALQNLRTNSPSFSYSDGTPAYAPGQQVVHDRLHKLGLLDDSDFCREFGFFIHEIAFGVLFELLTLHDGSWDLNSSHRLKLHAESGEKLVEFLHELSSDPKPPVL